MSSVRPFDAEARAETTEWLESWARMGPLLEVRRVSALRQLTGAESARRLAAGRSIEKSINAVPAFVV